MKNPGLYILTNRVNGKQYVGKDSRLPYRVKQHLSGKDPTCRRVHNAIKKYGNENFSVEIIQYPNISHEALNAVERWKIRQLHTRSPGGYNLTDGGDSGKYSKETRQKISESNSKRVADGTHHFLGGEISRRTHKKRLDEGTHNFLGDNNPVHKQIANGTHHFLSGEIQRRANQKRLDEGTHNFLDSEFARRANQKRLDEGTHNFLGGEINQERVANGTHNFLGDNNPMKRLAKEGRHPSAIKRLKAEWCYIIALSRFWYEIHDYTLKRRTEFLSKNIPDMSNAEQEYLF